MLSDLGVTITQEAEHFFVPHPTQAGARMFLDGQSLVSESWECPLVACNIFDYLGLMMQSVEDAVDFVIARYFQAAQVSPGTSLQSLKPVFIEGIRGDRKQFEDVLSLRQHQVTDTNFIEPFLWCQNRGLSTRYSWRSFYVAKKADLIPLLDNEANRNLKLESNYYVVFPYLINPHTYGWLKVFAVSGRQQFTIPFHESETGIFGLHTCLPSSQEIRVYGDPFEAQAAFSSEAEMAHTQIASLHVAVTSSAVPNSYRIPKAVFVQNEKTLLSEIALARRMVNQLSVTYLNGPDPSLKALQPQSIPWLAHILHEVVRILKQSGLASPEFASLIDVLRPDHDLCNAVLRHLRNSQSKDVLDFIRERLNTNQVISLSNLDILETPNGYVARRGNVATPFTNFIVRMDHNVVFDGDDTEVVHCGRVVMQGREFPVVLPQRLLDRRPADIPGACLKAIMASDVSEQAGFIPQIVDTTYVRRLGEVLRIQAGKKGNKQGIRVLGWSADRSRFITPAWQVTARECSETSHIPYPYSDFLKTHYDFNAYAYLPGEQYVTPSVRTFICLVVSGLVRAQLHLPFPALHVLRHPSAIDLLHALFRPFGQIQPIHFGSQRRTIQGILSPDNVVQYPVFGIATDPDIVDEVNCPVFLIADNGQPFHDQISQEAYSQIAGIAQSVYQTVLVHSLRNTNQIHTLIHDAENTSISYLTGEGRRIIETALGKDFGVFATDLPAFETLLRQIPITQLEEYFRYDLGTEKVFVRLRKLSPEDRREIVQELPARRDFIRKHADHYLVADAQPFITLLEEFYGQPVKLFHHEPENEITAPAVSAQDAPAQSTL